MNRIRCVGIIASTVLREAVRRKDVYVIVLLCCGLIATVMSLNFFGLSGLVKFYREIALKLMGGSTAIAVVLLATRQLPREFEYKTIYPLLARPISRWTFLLGKGLGVLAAAAFCFGLFMLIYVIGIFMLDGHLALGLFLQHIYLQLLQMMVLTALCFLLSLTVHYDAAVVLGLLLYVASGILSSASVALYSLTSTVGRLFLYLLTYGLPQLVLFDLSGKVIHYEPQYHDLLWKPLPLQTMTALTLYAGIYLSIFMLGAYLRFRRRPL